MSVEFEQGVLCHERQAERKILISKKKGFNSATKILKRRTILSLKLPVKALKLPFTKTQKAEFKNNASALNNNVFVDSAIKELLGT